MIEKQKTMDRKASRTNLVASNAGASIISPEHSKHGFSFSPEPRRTFLAFTSAVNSLKKSGLFPAGQF